MKLYHLQMVGPMGELLQLPVRNMEINFSKPLEGWLTLFKCVLLGFFPLTSIWHQLGF